MADTLAGIDGVKVFIDDILVYGSGDTLQEALADHDRKIEKLFARLNKLNITLNPEKIQYKKRELKYMGHIISDNGIKIDNEKIKAIREMVVPNNVKQLRSFLGMVNYLAKFIKNLSDKARILRELEKKDIDWNWSKEHDEAYQELKHMIANTSTLKYFNPNEKVTI